MTTVVSPVVEPARRVAGGWAAPVLAGLAVVLWVVFAGPVDPGGLGSFGLIVALHPVVLLAIVVLSVAFVLELREPAPRTWVLAGACVLAVIGLYGLPSIVEPVARLPVAWLHAGWSEYVAEHGAVLPGFDARFSWPGFFAVAAWVSEVAGVDVTAMLAWAPPVFTGLAAIGVHAVATAVLGRGPGAWFAVWLFLAANWVEQDYFSPQALAFLLYVGALAIVLRWLVRVESPQRTLGAAAALVLLLCALAPAHQVTPFALAAVLLALAGRLRWRWLAVLAVLAPLTWLVLGASDYWIGNLDVLTGGVGDVSDSVQENVAARVTGDAGRMTVLGLRFGLVGVVLALAVVGWWGRGRPVALGIATVVPFGLVALQSYGGEMLLRSFLYALPLLCTFGGAALARWRAGFRGIAVGVALGVMSVALVAARGGNDGYVSFRDEDVAAVEEAYRIAEPGSSIASLTAYVPLRSARVGEVTQDSLERACASRSPVPCVLDEAPDTLLVTRAQDNYGVIMAGLPAGWSSTVAAGLVSSGAYREHWRLGDAVVLIHVDTQGDSR